MRKARVLQDVAISSDGIRVSYEERGAGTPALVFVHGWSCDRSYWDGQVEPFAREFRVVTIDLAGHGESGLGRRKWTIESFGQDVAAVVDKLGLQSMVLIGHSMGGDVIVDAARRLPNRVGGLVWVDTYRRLTRQSTPEQIQERLAPFRADFVPTAQAMIRGMFPANADQDLVERIVADMCAAPVDVALEAAEAAWSYGPVITATLPELDIPLVAINPADPPSDKESLKRYGVELVSMPDVGHFPMMEKPQVFNELLLEVVRGFVR
jgi:pimeloyl-ACP methyl ester carboxylesterase